MPPSARPSSPPVLTLLCVAVAIVAAAMPGLASTPFAAAAIWAVCLTTTADVAWRCASLALPAATTSVFLAAVALFGESLTSATVMLLGSAGWFRLPAVALVLAAVHGVSVRGCPSRRRLEWRVLLSVREVPLVVVAAFLAPIAVWLFVVHNQVLYTTQDADSMMYHLVMAGEWVRTGSTHPIETLPLVAVAYPGFRQAILAFLSLPFGNEHLALLGVFEYPLLAASVYALARHWGAARAMALGAAGYAASTPVVIGSLGNQGTDVCLAIHVLLATLYSMRFLASGDRGEAVTAGLALGALSATKFSGPSYAAVILLLAAGAHGFRIWRHRGGLAWLGAAAALVAGPWYVRNLLVFGNPFHPAEISLGGTVVFAGPLGPDYFQRESLGFRLRPLLDHLHQFVEAHGPLAPLMGAGALLLTVAAAVRRERWELIPAILLPPLLFTAFLHHPYTLPSFDAAHTHRFLIAWFAVSVVATAVACPKVAWLSTPVVALCIAAVFFTLHEKTSMALPLALVVILATALSRLPALASVAAALCTKVSKAPALVVVAGLGLAAFGLQDLRTAQQYDPDYGYRDSRSERGWAGVSTWVHRNVAGKRVGLHGSIFCFPLLGEPFRNAVFVADDLLLRGPSQDAAAVATWAADRNLDYLVCCVPRLARTGSRAFEFGVSIADELQRLHPERFQVAARSHGACVLEVRR